LTPIGGKRYSSCRKQAAPPGNRTKDESREGGKGKLLGVQNKERCGLGKKEREKKCKSSGVGRGT
jgi:hypothetical protein